MFCVLSSIVTPTPLIGSVLGSTCNAHIHMFGDDMPLWVACLEGSAVAS
jgi:hypothetical protein